MFNAIRHTSSWLTLFAGLLLTQTASASQACNNASIPTSTTNWSNSVLIPKFDPSLGVLTNVSFTLAGTATGSAEAESMDAAPSTVTLNFQCTLTLTRPDNSIIVAAIPLQQFIDQFTAFDGTVDFGGTSGMTHPNLLVTDTQAASSLTASDLALFTGPAGSPGTISLPLTAIATSSASGAGNLVTQFAQTASAIVTVCYDFTPTTISVFCIGDGIGLASPCPCANDGGAGLPSGCLNATGLGGMMSFTGSASINNDTLHLTITQLPLNAQGWFIQGSATPNGGNGTPFGHGIRCLRGDLTIMQKIAIGGNVLPPAGSPPISVLFGISAGQTKYYQGWYRDADPVGSCGGGQLNTTNAISVIWQL
jgi:hypothetical protein